MSVSTETGRAAEILIQDVLIDHHNPKLMGHQGTKGIYIKDGMNIKIRDCDMRTQLKKWIVLDGLKYQ